MEALVTARRLPIPLGVGLLLRPARVLPTLMPFGTFRRAAKPALDAVQAIMEGAVPFGACRRHIESVLLLARRIPSRQPAFTQRVVVCVRAGVPRLLEMKGDPSFALYLSRVVRVRPRAVIVIHSDLGEPAAVADRTFDRTELAGSPALIADHLKPTAPINTAMCGKR